MDGSSVSGRHNIARFLGGELQVLSGIACGETRRTLDRFVFVLEPVLHILEPVALPAPDFAHARPRARRLLTPVHHVWVKVGHGAGHLDAQPQHLRSTSTGRPWDG